MVQVEVVVKHKGMQITQRAELGMMEAISKGSYLDVPPSWSGENADKLLQTYLKAAEMWRLTTKTPARQRGVQLMSAAGGDLRIVIGELSIEQLTSDDSAENVINLVKKEYAYAITKQLPSALEDALFARAGSRRQGETLVSFTARKVQLLRELDRCGCSLPGVARGLRELERPRVGNEGQAAYAVYDEDNPDEWQEGEDGEQPQEEDDADPEAQWDEEDALSVPEEVAHYIYAQHLMGPA
eukprot:5828206-Amphidinium_carterae.1